MGLVLLKRDEHLRYLRKPAEIPTTFGQEQSFLELVMEMNTGSQQGLGSQGESKMSRRQREVRTQIPRYLHLGDMIEGSMGMPPQEESPQEEVLLDENLVQTFISEQRKCFSAKEEWGLVNRLDTGTMGYIYVATNRETYAAWGARQQAESIKKHYYALVHGDIRYMRNGGTTREEKIPLQEGQDSRKLLKDNGNSPQDSKNKDARTAVRTNSIDNTLHIAFAIAHHLQLDDRMVALITDVEAKKTRGSPQSCESAVKVLRYFPDDNMTLVEVELTKGVRHQIRVHLAAIGYPLVGDMLYGKRHYEKLRKNSPESEKDDAQTIPLHLRSTGCDIVL